MGQVSNPFLSGTVCYVYSQTKIIRTLITMRYWKVTILRLNYRWMGWEMWRMVVRKARVKYFN